MVSTLASSPAFLAAALRSEVRRAWAVIGVIVLMVLLVLVREVRGQLDGRVIVAAVIAISLLFVVQLAVLGVAGWARRRGRSIPGWFVILVVAIESLTPTGLMVSHIVPGTLPPYASLSSPALLAYGLLIGLTTLWLRPMLCVLAG